MISRTSAWHGVTLLFLSMGWAVPARADIITYDITADTSSVNGTTGSLDFQFNSNAIPGMDTAVINSFMGGTPGTLPGMTGFTSGNISGDLTSLPVTLSDNSMSLTNELMQDFSYTADTLNLSVTIATALGTPGPSFYLMLLDMNGNAFDSFNSVTGYAAEIDSVPVSGTQVVGPSGPGVTVTAEISSVPEPASAVLLGVGAIGLAAYSRWRTARHSDARR